MTFFLGLSVWLVIDFSTLLVQIIRVLAFFVIGMKASRVLFQDMTHAILRAPLRWIDTVPAGRILNRFTSDMFIVDRRLSNQAFTLIRTVLFLLVIIATRYSGRFVLPPYTQITDLMGIVCQFRCTSFSSASSCSYSTSECPWRTSTLPERSSESTPCPILRSTISSALCFLVSQLSGPSTAPSST